MATLQQSVAPEKSSQREKEFPLAIYTGGAVVMGAMGVTYAIPPLASYLAKADITFDELKRAVYQLTRINEEEFGINISARYNSSTDGGCYHYIELLIDNNCKWRHLVEKTLSGATRLSAIELFIDPREKSQPNVERAGTAKHQAHVGCQTKEALQGEDGDSAEHSTPNKRPKRQRSSSQMPEHGPHATIARNQRAKKATKATKEHQPDVSDDTTQYYMASPAVIMEQDTAISRERVELGRTSP